VLRAIATIEIDVDIETVALNAIQSNRHEQHQSSIDAAATREPNLIVDSPRRDFLCNVVGF